MKKKVKGENSSMRENIIIFSHNTHSFLNNEISHAAKAFKRIVVITPYNIEIKEVADKYSNVETIFYNKKDLYKNALFSFPRIINKTERNDLKESFHKRKLNLNYFRHYSMFLSAERIFINILKRNLKLSVNESRNWVFYSAWYYGTAYAVAKAKIKYSDAKIISLAHSFEIDREKNDYTHLLFRKFYHTHLDQLSFISRNVYEMYKNDVANPLNLSIENIDVNYLGAMKIEEGFSISSNDGKIRIVSCSHMVPIKRLNLIFESLDKMQNCEIVWTHIGDGVEMESLKKCISEKKNKNLEVIMLGNIKNTSIHNYYVNNPVDIFINTSASEGIPVTIMEAIAYGIPVIATDVGGNSEIVKKDFGRLLNKNPQNKDIETAITELVNIPPAEKNKMRISAYNYFNEYFNANKIRKEFFYELSKE